MASAHLTYFFFFFSPHLFNGIFVQPELPAGRCSHSGRKPCRQRCHHSFEESPGRLLRCGMETGAEYWKRWEALCVPGLGGAAFSSLLQKCPKPGMPPWTPAWHPKSVEVGGSAPLQSFSKHDPRNSSNSISRQLVRNAESGPHLTPTASKSLEVGPRNLHFTSILLGCL